jgi:hypothetical protein
MTACGPCQVLDAIAAAEGFTDAKKQHDGFGNTLSSDDEDNNSDDGQRTHRSSACGSDVSGLLAGMGVVPGVTAAQPPPFTAVPSSDHPLSPGQRGLSGDGTDEYYQVNSPAATSKASSLMAAMESYYQLFRVKRDEHRNDFLQEAESFLLEHLTAPPPTSMQQITSELALSPGAALVQSVKVKATRQATKLRNAAASMSSPILSSLANSRHSAGRNGSHSGTKAGTLSPSPRTAPSALRQAKTREALEAAEADLSNRFAHYTAVGLPTVHHIRVPGYIDDFRIDLKALLTTKVPCCLYLLAVRC